MKRLLKKRLLGIPVGIIAGLVLTTGIVLAAVFTLAIPSHVEITPAPPPDTWNIGVYENAECTIPVTFIEWEQVEVGTTLDKIVYIRNEGTVPAVVTVSFTIGPPLVTWQVSPSPLELDAGASGACTLSLTAGAIPGSINFSTSFDSNPQ
ncbi:hypothetical protein ES707_15980 [subsurface metagenome]|jgi:hypothetical protein